MSQTDSEHGASAPLPHDCRWRIFCFEHMAESPAMPVPTAINSGQVATGYDNSRRVEPAVAVAMVEALHSLRARSVLEIGAGTGNYTGALMASGLSVIPLDRSRTMVEIGAQKTFAPWILADAAALPLRRASVDAIAGVNVLHHLPALPVALAEFRRGRARRRCAASRRARITSSAKRRTSSGKNGC